MRYRTAAILCSVLIGGMFVLPVIIWAVFLPSLQQDLPNPIPTYERILLEIAVFRGHWRWLLAFPIVGLGLVFAIAELTSASRARK